MRRDASSRFHAPFLGGVQEMEGGEKTRQVTDPSVANHTEY